MVRLGGAEREKRTGGGGGDEVWRGLLLWGCCGLKEVVDSRDQGEGGRVALRSASKPLPKAAATEIFPSLPEAVLEHPVEGRGHGQRTSWLRLPTASSIDCGGDMSSNGRQQTA